MTHVSLNIHALKAANKAASEEETRFYLKGVRVIVTQDTTTYVATNGAILFAYQEEAAHTSTEPLLGEWTIPSTVIAKMKCPKANRRQRGRFQYSFATMTVSDDGTLNTQFGDDKHEFKAVDGTYPDWRRVIPLKTDPTEPVHNYNPDYLAALKKAGEIMGQSANSSNFDLHYNGSGPAMITYSSVENALGIIMPYRANTGAINCPSWVRATGESVSKAA